MSVGSRLSTRSNRHEHREVWKLELANWKTEIGNSGHHKGSHRQVQFWRRLARTLNPEAESRSLNHDYCPELRIPGP